MKPFSGTADRSNARKGANLIATALGTTLALAGVTCALASPAEWKYEWPNTDFTKTAVEFSEIFSGGPPKDGIPSIDNPRFKPLTEYEGAIDREPVITFRQGQDVRAYPLRVLIWHEIVNDTVGGIPVAVTYCPLCNSSIVFDRRSDGKTLDFGTTGKLRNSDLVMYDRQTESWWQQFTGTAIVGTLKGQSLKILPSRVESLARFRNRFPEGRVLVPNRPSMRPYGANPYFRYDTSARPFLYSGTLPEGIEPLAYVVRVGNEAWPLDILKDKRKIVSGDVVIEWAPGQSSALDAQVIAEGRDIGNVVVKRRTPDGLVDEIHDVTFAFVFHAFVESGTIHLK